MKSVMEYLKRVCKGSAKNNQIWVSPTKDKKWQVKHSGMKEAHVFTTKKAAVSAARKLAKFEKKELVVQNKDGKIKQKDSFGKDPKKIKG